MSFIQANSESFTASSFSVSRLDPPNNATPPLLLDKWANASLRL